MTKLGALLQESINKTTTHLTNFMKFQKDVVSEEVVSKYEGIKLLNYDVNSESIKNSYDDIINLLTDNDSKRFANLQLHLVFKNINLLDCNRWPSEKKTSQVMEKVIWMS